MWDQLQRIREIPGAALDALPDGWHEEDSVLNTAKRGTEWAHSMSTAVLQVPSAAIHEEFNYILNPLHPDFASIRFDIPDAEYIDRRLRKPSSRHVPK